ncbi:unnamed protein product, partial [Mesorhabditis spiculigera]
MRLYLLILVATLAAVAAQPKPPPTNQGNGANPALVLLLRDLRKFRAAGGHPQAQAWKNHAVKFCQFFPGHPKCSGEKTPPFGAVGAMMQVTQKRVMLQRQQFHKKQQRARMQRRKLKRIPKLQKRKDPLANSPKALADKIPEDARHWGRMKAEQRQKVKQLCGKINCKAWEKHKANRDRLKGQMKKFRKQVGKTEDKDDDDDDALELELQRTRQLKKALLEKAELAADVEPADDGIFDSDLLLTTEQSEFLLNELDKGGEEEEEPLPPGFEATESPEATTLDPDYDSSLAEEDSDDYHVEADDPDAVAAEKPADPVLSRRARAALFFEEQFVRKWDINQPIQYTFHESLEEIDKNTVRQALQTISTNVPCLRFQYIQRPVTNGYFLYYMKTDMPGFCGLSRIGKVTGGNPIYLSFTCNGNVGVTIHETMHSLGVDHQHIRMDRDKWIKVDWSNVNPQMYDALAVSDAKTFTSYGVAYDYASVMHYNAYTAAIDYNKPTLNPLVNPAQNIRVMGQRDAMTQRDVEILRKMYCKAASCVDTNIYCGAWALSSLCTTSGNSGWMQQNCRKSCNLC